MTEEKEGPVHYQVSVTSRQAAAFFLVLLAALGLSFFFGMKTGAASRRGPDSVTALAAQSDLPVPTVSAAGDEEKAETVPTEVPIGFEPAAPRPEAEPSRSEPPTPKAQARAEEPPPVVKELAPPPEPVERAGAKPAAEPKAPPAAEEEGPFWVQILVTKSAEKADELAKKLRADGFRPDVSLVPGKKGLFRVRVGSYPSRAKAEAAAKKVAKAEKLQAKPIVLPGK